MSIGVRADSPPQVLMTHCSRTRLTRVAAAAGRRIVSYVHTPLSPMRNRRASMERDSERRRSVGRLSMNRWMIFGEVADRSLRS